MATSTALPAASMKRPWWQTAAWIGLLLLGAFNLFAVASDLTADSGIGMPSDHTGTSAKVAAAAGRRLSPRSQARRTTSPRWNAGTPSTRWCTHSCSWRSWCFPSAGPREGLTLAQPLFPTIRSDMACKPSGRPTDRHRVVSNWRGPAVAVGAGDVPRAGRTEAQKPGPQPGPAEAQPPEVVWQIRSTPSQRR
jgi:hypothetical protein